ncbi:glucose-6-phosphate dehydrogenase [Pseudovibrio exalbescens]|uniref:glucose-6-phosphate dehydrogenase n=1 Tax=Pseudovibrio exalbescens TaxID=197461 RepID=UPI00236573B2|nr:glucose-6-phosphate dehydrogenase [Pseudovibrio exalbescens]MDD7910387.1 glucose-6-phosphate dehydrogenase [Pseudovibrio exalbescens]
MPVRMTQLAPFDLIVFGGTGDLAHRKLLPALYYRELDGQLHDDSRIIAVSRRDLSAEDYRDWAHKSVAAQVSNLCNMSMERFLKRITYVSVNVEENTGWESLEETLKGRENIDRAFYLSVAPSLFGPICSAIGEHNLVTDETRVTIEKPIGRDGESAHAVNETVGSVFKEHQIFRIDHYLGKETVQNLMALRFANVMFEPLWNSAHIDHVQITVAETLGVEKRAGYYDTAGALRDMVQNHLLQLLCLVAMEPPESMAADSVRDEKLKVLKALVPMDEERVRRNTVRGQYRPGASAGGAVQGYLEEVGSPDSQTETFVAAKVEIANWRWAGVPFYMRTGKRLASRLSEIVIQFKDLPHSIFLEEAGTISANQLIIRLQPDEGVKMQLMIKDPGPGGMRLRKVPLDMTFAEAFKVRNVDAYERLIFDMIRGNQTLFMRRDEVEAAWKWIDPILEHWSNDKEALKGYTSGTWGPSASIALIERDGRTWHED